MSVQHLPAGATIGILGGGQLGRMLAMSAAQLGYRCHIYAPEKDSVAADVAAKFTCASWHDKAALQAFAADCGAITYEFENVPVAPLSALPGGMLAPGTMALEVAQDRYREKRFIEQLGGRPAPYAAVDHDTELDEAIRKVGTPGIMKTRRDGYDGKGQWRVEGATVATGLRVPESGLVYEGLVHFEAEFSVILVRSRTGEVRFWDSPRNTHVGGILSHSELPVPPIVANQVAEARALAQRAAEELGYVGVMACEFFATTTGPVFNEMAPRVHNSGHWTIEGAVTSQFENHIRAVAGLPLGDTASMSPRMVMDNLIGPDALDLVRHLSDPAAHLHLYGKAEARAGRKMGHVTRVG
jgi:5-(carboxyamino)imidazole ribonucleotide synthase